MIAHIFIFQIFFQSISYSFENYYLALDAFRTCSCSYLTWPNTSIWEYSILNSCIQCDNVILFHTYKLFYEVKWIHLLFWLIYAYKLRCVANMFYWKCQYAGIRLILSQLCMSDSCHPKTDVTRTVATPIHLLTGADSYHTNRFVT